MEITEVRVRLLADASDHLKAVCTITLDEQFVIRDMKIVEGTHGLFVAMPSRKLSAGCPRCRCQNHLRAKHCNECGTKLPPMSIPRDDNGREKAHRDVAHPITAAVREMLQDKVLKAYADERETERSESETVSAGKEEDEFGPSSDAPVEAPKEPVGLVREETSVETFEPARADVSEVPSFGSGLPAESDDEPAVESPVPVGEYNSLIADLKGGAKRRGNEAQKPSSDERGPRKRRRCGSRGAGRDGDDDAHKREDARPRETTPEVVAESALADRATREAPQPEPRPADPAPVKSQAPPVHVPQEPCGFGAGLDEPVEPAAATAPGTRAEQPRREVQSPVETKEPQGFAEVSSDDTATRSEARPVEEANDDAGFGAGIL